MSPASGSSDPKNRIKLGVALGLLLLAGAVLAWQYLHSSEPPVDDATAKKEQEIRASIDASAAKNPAPQAPVVPRSRRGGPINPGK